MKKIIIINGTGTSGKDEVVNITKELYKEIYVESISSVGSVKEKAISFGWDGEKNDKGRRLLSDLKDAWTKYCDGPFEDIKGKINLISTIKNFILFVHIRESDEIQKMFDFYKDLVVTLLIRRPDIKQYNNHADANIEDYHYDYIIENDGTLDDLKENVKIFLDDLLKGKVD